MTKPVKLDGASLTMIGDRHLEHTISRRCDGCALLGHITALDLELADLRLQRDGAGDALVAVTAERDEARAAIGERVAEVYRLKAALEKCAADVDAAAARGAELLLKRNALADQVEQLDKIARAARAWHEAMRVDDYKLQDTACQALDDLIIAEVRR